LNSRDQIVATVTFEKEVFLERKPFGYCCNSFGRRFDGSVRTGRDSFQTHERATGGTMAGAEIALPIDVNAVDE
jgi:hypothetical protein